MADLSLRCIFFLSGETNFEYFYQISTRTFDFPEKTSSAFRSFLFFNQCLGFVCLVLGAIPMTLFLSLCVFIDFLVFVWFSFTVFKTNQQTDPQA